MTARRSIFVAACAAAVAAAAAAASAWSGPDGAEGSTSAVQPSPSTSVGYVVVNEFPHDTNAFTQGLAFHRRALFESTGLYGESTVRRVDLETGQVLARRDLAARYFGEGLTIFKGEVWQITWKENRAFVYDRQSFDVARRFNYQGEGWGLADRGRKLIMSNGSDVIVFRSPRNFEVKRSIDVRDEGTAVQRLNELEWVNGEIFANVWQTNDIVRIDPATGEVTGRLDLTPLAEREESEGDPDVANGIAYLASEDRLFVTGKYWAHLYEIELLEP